MLGLIRVSCSVLSALLLPLWVVSTIGMVSNVVDVINCGRWEYFDARFRFGNARKSTRRATSVGCSQHVDLRMVIQLKNDSDSEFDYIDSKANRTTLNLLYGWNKLVIFAVNGPIGPKRPAATFRSCF